jgi:hypothetical protein
MKKVFALFLALTLFLQSFASSAVTPPKNANEIFIPIGTTGNRISLMALSQIDLKTLETLTGRRIGFVNKISFKLAQRNLRKSIHPDGTVNAKKLKRFISDGDHSTGFHGGGFALGFFVGLIGVLIAYLIKDDIKPNRVKWAWIGFGIRTVLSVIVLLLFLSSYGGY